jgi:hypothetical protein
MALCRCIGNHSWPIGKRGINYVAYAQPIGYPNTAAVCPHCLDSAIIWLNEEETSNYENGERF